MLTPPSLFDDDDDYGYEDDDDVFLMLFRSNTLIRWFWHYDGAHLFSSGQTKSLLKLNKLFFSF